MTGPSGGANRVVGGVEAHPQSWPWIANLFVQTQTQVNEGGASLCGATIIHETWLLTAAHCCEGRVNVFARFGQHNLNAIDSGEFTIATGDIFIHPAYSEESDGSSQNHDFCLLRLDESIIQRGQAECSGNCVAIACLPTSAPVIGRQHFSY